MKGLKIMAIVFVLMFMISCKKEYITQAQLLGTWFEIEPCVRDSNSCYTLQFTTNNKIYVSTPFIDTANYTLFTNNSIQIDESVNCGPGTIGTGSYQISLNGNELIISQFYTPCFSVGITKPPVYDIHLKKN